MNSEERYQSFNKILQLSIDVINAKETFETEKYEYNKKQLREKYSFKDCSLPTVAERPNRHAIKKMLDEQRSNNEQLPILEPVTEEYFSQYQKYKLVQMNEKVDWSVKSTCSKINLVGPGAATPLMAATNITAGPAGDKDYSPFSPFKMPGNIVNWGQSVPAAGNNDQKKGNSEATFKGFPAAGGEDMSKAPGYRTGNNSGNININPGGNSQNNAAGQIQSAAAGNWTSSKPGGGSNVPVDNNQLYQTQERCNSAPGM